MNVSRLTKSFPLIWAVGNDCRIILNNCKRVNPRWRPYCCDVGAAKLIFLFLRSGGWAVRFLCAVRILSSNLDFENEDAREWNSVDCTSPRGELAPGSRNEQGSRIFHIFGKFGLMFICQFLGTSYHSFQRMFKEDLKRVSDQFGRVLSSRTKEKRSTIFSFGPVFILHVYSTKTST